MLFNQSNVADLSELALTDLARQRSWAELRESVVAIAHFINHQAGVQRGDHIALHIGNRVEFIEAMLGGILAGVWVTPINTHLTDSEALYILQDTGTQLLFFDDDNCALDSRLNHVQCVNVNEFAGLPNRQEPIDFDLTAGGTMLYTSGTTGKPKGVKRNQPGSLYDAFNKMRIGAEGFGLKGDGPHLVTGPLYHAAPMLFALYDLLNGAPMVIMPRWKTDLFMESVERFGVVSTHLVPTMFVRLLNDFGQDKDSFDVSSLKLVLHGAAPIAKSTKLSMLDWWGDLLVEYWGGSEAGTTTLVTSQDWREHPGTVGKPLAHYEVYIGDEQGNPTGDREGLLYCKHKDLPQVFEYHNDAAKTLKAHPMPHVFCIGDIGYLDSDGFVYLSDRASNMIISGGVNIYPAEVEQALIESDSVLDCAVFGVKDEEWGEQVKAIVQLSDRNDVIIAQLESHLIEFLRERIASYKVPRSIEVVNSIPRTPSGKVKLKDLEPYR